MKVEITSKLLSYLIELTDVYTQLNNEKMLKRLWLAFSLGYILIGLSMAHASATF